MVGELKEKSEQEPNESTYLEMLKSIQEDPYSEEVWQSTVELAKREEVSGGGSENYYSRIPLEELISVGERLRAAREKDQEHYSSKRSKVEEYRVLTERASTGEYWYDIILGHVNDRAFAPVISRLGNLVKSRPGKKFETGLDIGSGLGNTLRDAAPYCAKIIGVEKLDFLAEEVRNNPSMPENTEVVTVDAVYEKLPFADESFDVIVSNGLTHYLDDGEMLALASKISRLLKDGGSYIEAYTVKEPGDLLPVTEKEYLTSAKTLLVCLMDNICSKVKIEPGRSWNLSDLATVFAKHGVYMRHDAGNYREDMVSKREIGAVAVEFVKSKKEQQARQEAAKTGWISSAGE